MWSPFIPQVFCLWIWSSVAQIIIGQSVFISKGNEVSFGINIPKENTADLYFALRGRLSNTWTAVGLGQKDMKGALVFLIYQNEAGTNVTLSTRLSTSYVEPDWSPDFHVRALPGTGIDNESGTLIFNGRCSDCQTWPGGSLDTNNTHEPFIYAIGPGGYLRGDDPLVSVRYHAGYGWFTMNIPNAIGPSHVPLLQKSTGSEAGNEYMDQTDLVATTHGIVLLVCFLGLFPLCVIVLHLFQMPRLFKVGKIITGIVTLVGIGIGIYGGTYYNKTENMSTPHQIIGFIVLAFIVIEAILGPAYLFRNRRNKTSDQKTSRPMHIFITTLGRLTLLLGCINGFLGYELAGHGDKNKVVGGVFAGVFVILFLTLVVAHRRDARSKDGTGG